MVPTDPSDSWTIYSPKQGNELKVIEKSSLFAIMNAGTDCQVNINTASGTINVGVMSCGCKGIRRPASSYH